MVALMVVVVDEGLNPGFEITWQEVVFQEDAVLQCLVPTLDLALSLGMIWSAAGMLHALVLQPFSQFTRDVAGSVVAEQTWFVNDVNLIATRRCQSQVQRVRHVLSPHVCAEFPRDDVAAVIVQDRTKIEPAPADDLQVGEVGLLQLVDSRRLVFELTGRFDHDEGWAGDQVVRLQHAIDGSL